MDKKFFAAVLIYLGFYTLIGIAIYVSKSLIPLWALLFSPEITSDNTNNINNNEN